MSILLYSFNQKFFLSKAGLIQNFCVVRPKKSQKFVVFIAFWPYTQKTCSQAPLFENSGAWEPNFFVYGIKF